MEIQSSLIILGFLLLGFNQGGDCRDFGRADDGETYMVGVGISDVTGPAAEIGLMGYANPAQLARGIHFRLFSRAFIFQSGDQNNRVVFVSIDAAMMDHSIKREVIAKLEAKYGDMYSAKNVLLSGTHTHSGPGGYIEYAMYGIVSLGFHKPNFDVIVEGIVQSIERAHQDLQPGKVFLNQGELDGDYDANINRSPAAYDMNPQEERDRYTRNVDKNMVLLRIESIEGKPLGSINWFAVHPTSMNNTNTLISGDNKGYASMLFEYEMNPNARPGKGEFVAAFASANLGDVSPNIEGPRCIDTGAECDLIESTCNGYVQKCIAFGPGKFGNMEESTEIIGRRQFSRALELFNSKATSMPLSGRVDFRHQYINMSNYEVTYTNETTGDQKTVRTCPGALGYSFAAGTTDGPGMFDFTQGDTSGNPFWDFISSFLRSPSKEQVECHEPKPILLDIGEYHLPYEWGPSIVDTQVFRIGQLYIVGVPGELTTMSGRRIRETLKARIEALTDETNVQVVIAGLSNVYTHYIATFEEYQRQRYEGASTIFGPHTLLAYQQQYTYLAEAMLEGTQVPEGTKPEKSELGQSISFLAPIIMDSEPIGFRFGSAKLEPYPLYEAGETVKTVFVSGHPRNNPMREGTFFLVERLREDSTGWDVVASDADWNTKFRWRRPFVLAPHSEVEITWKTSPETTPGIYRVRHFGFYKNILFKEPKPYHGTSRTFEVRSKSLKSKINFNRERVNSPLVNFWKKITHTIGRR